MSKYLIEERPLTVLPTLVGALGFERACIVQQIHWLCNQPNSGKVLDDGEKWVWGTYEEWCELFFTFWEAGNLRKHMNVLEQQGIILSCQPNAKDWDRTKHYRIDVEKLEAEIEQYLQKKAEKAHSHRTATTVAHRSGISSPSNRPSGSASKRDSSSASNRPSSSTSNSYSSSGSYKEQSSLTELSTEPSAEGEEDAEEQLRLETEARFKVATQLLKDKLNNRADADGEGTYYSCLLEDPTRLAWLTLRPSEIRDLIKQATSEYKSGARFKRTLIDLLDRATRDLRKPQTPSASAEVPPPEPLSLEERKKITEEATNRLPPALRKALAARGEHSVN